MYPYTHVYRIYVICQSRRCMPLITSGRAAWMISSPPGKRALGNFIHKAQGLWLQVCDGMWIYREIEVFKRLCFYGPIYGL